MISVALIGPDGAGKSTIGRLLESQTMPAPVKCIYMGVNLQASGLMLPTTRLALMLKRARGGRPDMTASTGARPAQGDAGSNVARAMRGGAQAVRLVLWCAEEWFRQLVAMWYLARGTIVVFDRHFFADYYYTDIATTGHGRGPIARVHGWMLGHVYPKPDLVICLDAPAEVLYLRKPESSLEWLEQRRQQYLRLADVVPALDVVNVDRPLEVVVAEVVERIGTHWEVVST